MYPTVRHLGKTTTKTLSTMELCTVLFSRLSNLLSDILLLGQHSWMYYKRGPQHNSGIDVHQSDQTNEIIYMLLSHSCLKSYIVK